MVLKKSSKKFFFKRGASISATAFLTLKSFPPILPFGFAAVAGAGSSLVLVGDENDFQLNPP